MKRCVLAGAIAPLVLSVTGTTAHAQSTATTPQDDGAPADEPTGAVHEREAAAGSLESEPPEAIDVEVRGEPVALDEPVDPQALQLARHANTADALAEIPGVWAVRRGAGAAEPSIRGLGWERVVTQVGSLPLYGACPGRMDPPVNYARPHAIHELLVVKGVNSVTLGPSTTGARILLRPDYERPTRTVDSVRGWSSWKVDSSRRGMGGDAGVRGGVGPLDFSVGAEAMRLHDYLTPSGLQMPAEQAEWSWSESLAYHPSDGHRLWQALSYVHHDRMSYPALPMDLERTDYWQAHAGYRYQGTGALRQASLEFGFMNADHEMSNRSKPNRRMLIAHTPSTSRAYSGRAAVEISLARAGTLRSGVDGTALERDALRSRDLQPSGRHFEDPIWPDVQQTQRGLFAEWAVPLWWDLELRTGGRIDWWTQRARKADAPGLGGRSVREGYARFYGDDARDAVRGNLAGAVNGSLQWQPARELLMKVDVGWSSRVPAVTERFFSFAPAPAGFLVGNPSLEPEREIEVDGGFRWEGQWLTLAFSGYSAWVDDYVLPTAVARADVNGDGQQDVVRGFRNVDASLIGAETSAIGHIGRHVDIPLTVGAVYGQNTTEGRPLPEIPPWDVTGAVRLKATAPTPWWVQFGVRVAAGQDRVDLRLPENPSPAFALLHMRTGVVLFEQLELEVDMENLLDTEYHEHLTRELAFPTASLPAGSELPAPGRTVFVSARWTKGWVL